MIKVHFVRLSSHQLIILHSQCQGLQIHTDNQNLSFPKRRGFLLCTQIKGNYQLTNSTFKSFLSQSKWSFQGPDVQIELGGQMLNI